MTVQISKHAEERMFQRGVKRASVELVVAYADVSAKRRGGAVRLRMSRRAMAEAFADGVDRRVVDGARAVAAVCRDGLVLTQYRARHDREWRAPRGKRAGGQTR